MSLSSQTGILLETSQTQIGEWDVTLAGAVEWEDNVVGMNSTYFLQVLEVIATSHVTIQFESPLSPILITPLADPDKTASSSEKFQHIIMPLKI